MLLTSVETCIIIKGMKHIPTKNAWYRPWPWIPALHHLMTLTARLALSVLQSRTPRWIRESDVADPLGYLRQGSIRIIKAKHSRLQEFGNFHGRCVRIHMLITYISGTEVLWPVVFPCWIGGWIKCRHMNKTNVLQCYSWHHCMLCVCFLLSAVFLPSHGTCDWCTAQPPFIVKNTAVRYEVSTAEKASVSQKLSCFSQNFRPAN